MTIDSFRRQHPRLIYQGFTHGLSAGGQPPGQVKLQVKYRFLLEPDIKFQPQIEISGLSASQLDHLQPDFLQALLFQLGLAELPSYWKAACPPEILVEAGSLDNYQVEWWQKLLRLGLGEFYFTNQIDFTQPEFVKISSADGASHAQPPRPPDASHYQTPYLVPVGGGKDSGLTLGLLDQNRAQYHTLVLEPASPAAARLCALSSTQHQITARRTICPNLLKLNQRGYLNGHTPFSAYLAFLSTTIAHLQGHQQILVANESSANQANLTYRNTPINHQWSKSFEFEQTFRRYSTQYLGSSTAPPSQTKSSQAEYLSFLRPLNELQIAQKFAQFPELLPHFRSCNVGQKQDDWCHRCPKCVFVFTMLFPFIDPAKLTTQIFKHNLFANIELLSTFQALADPTLDKPLECVGTDQEVQQALKLALAWHQEQQFELPPVIHHLENWLKNQIISENLLENWNKSHNLDEKLVKILKILKKS